VADIDIKGTIVDDDDAWIYDYFGINNTSPKKVKEILEAAKSKPLTVGINSGGGDLFAGNEIYYLLQSYKGKITVDIMGIAASAATVISCAGDRVRATPGAQFMIHNVSCGAWGDYREMDHTSEVLQNANKSISNIYRIKTGLSEKDLLELMDKETWMDATKAKEFGFVDEIIGDGGKLEDKPLTLRNAAGGFCKILDEEVKEKIRNTVRKPATAMEADFSIQRNKLNLLRLRGGQR
jgi:ATP-dependent protease ClpP protease subunit